MPEVRRITDECHQRALSILSGHREQLDALAHALLERETLDEHDAYAAVEIPHAPVIEAPPVAVA
jgi:cell division protease FtsH